MAEDKAATSRNVACISSKTKQPLRVLAAPFNGFNAQNLPEPLCFLQTQI
jgi:hypothetical protein